MSSVMLAEPNFSWTRVLAAASRERGEEATAAATSCRRNEGMSKRLESTTIIRQGKEDTSFSDISISSSRERAEEATAGSRDRPQVQGGKVITESTTRVIKQGREAKFALLVLTRFKGEDQKETLPGLLLKNRVFIGFEIGQATLSFCVLKTTRCKTSDLCPS